MQNFTRFSIKFTSYFTIFILFNLFGISKASAECQSKACIEVYVKDGKLVIDGRKDGSTSKPSSKPSLKQTFKPTAKPTPKLTPKLTPKPSTKPSSGSNSTKSKSSTLRKTYKPSPRPTVTTPSMADRILESLPTLQVAYQPEGAALIRVPVIFFTDLPTFFNKTYRIIGIPVSVNLRPNSLWDFGDGSKLITYKAGKPYPSNEITHSYSLPGIYPVKVSTIWTGTYNIAGQTFPINGRIEQVSIVEVKVVGAAAKFVGK